MIQLRDFLRFTDQDKDLILPFINSQNLFQKKEIPFYGDGSTARDYTYIDDIIDGI
jgi:UDP-glucuronate 4-epimerase